MTKIICFFCMPSAFSHGLVITGLILLYIILFKTFKD